MLKKIKIIGNQVGRSSVSAIRADSPKGTPSLALPKTAAKTAISTPNMMERLVLGSPLSSPQSAFLSPASGIAADMLGLCTSVRGRSVFRSRIDTTNPHKIAGPIWGSVLMGIYNSGCNPLFLIYSSGIAAYMLGLCNSVRGRSVFRRILQIQQRPTRLLDLFGRVFL